MLRWRRRMKPKCADRRGTRAGGSDDLAGNGFAQRPGARHRSRGSFPNWKRALRLNLHPARPNRRSMRCWRRTSSGSSIGRPSRSNRLSRRTRRQEPRSAATQVWVGWIGRPISRPNGEDQCAPLPADFSESTSFWTESARCTSFSSVRSCAFARLANVSSVRCCDSMRCCICK
jgi:hypothetical protein